MTTTQNATHLMPAQQALLDESLSLVKDHLRRFLNDPNFEEKIGLAFGQLDMTGLDKMRSLIQDLSESKGIPTIEILTAAEIEGAQGAFAAATNTIYLSEVLFESGNITTLAEVVLEEIGHYFDSQVNATDSEGDEGRIFAELIQSKELNLEQLEVLKAENDSNTLELNGNQLQVEQSEGIAISGKISFTDNTGKEQDLRGAKVLIYDYDPVGSDDLLATAYTNKEGKFNVLNIEKGSDVYIRVLAEGKSFRVEHDVPVNHAFYKQSETFDNLEGNKAINLKITDEDDRIHKAFVVHQALNQGEAYAANYRLNEMEKTQKKQPDGTFYKEMDTSAKLEVKLTDDYGSSFKGGVLNISEDAIWNYNQILFHYSHDLNHLITDIENIENYSGKDKETRLAWANGLAMFTVGMIAQFQHDLKNNRTFGNLQSGMYQGISLEHKESRPLAEGERNPYDIARIIWDITDGNKDTYESSKKDEYFFPAGELYEYLGKSQPFSIKRFNDFHEYINLFLRHDAYDDRATIGSILEEYGVSPFLGTISNSPEQGDFPQKIDLNESASPIFKWERDGNHKSLQVGQVFNSEFTVRVFNSDFSNNLLTSGTLNSSESESWQFGELEWVEKISSKKGQYHYIVEGIESSENMISGPYWSGAKTFYVGDVKQVKSSSLDKVREGTFQFKELLDGTQDIMQQLPNSSELGLAFLGDDIFGGKTVEPGTASIASLSSISSKSAISSGEIVSKDHALTSIINIFATISDKLQEIFPDPDEDLTEYHLRNAFHEILGDRGLGVLQDANNSGSVDFEDIEININGNLLSFQFPIGGSTNFDFQLPINLNLSSLGLELTNQNPNSQIDLDYTVNLGLGLDLETQEFFIDTSSSEDIVLSLDPTLSALEAKLGFLNVDITDNNSKFEFVLDLDDGPNGDNVLKLNEFSNLRITPNGTADINLDLLSKIDEDSPLFSTDLKLHWDFQENGVTPTVQFANNTIYLGTFLNEAITPNLDKLDPFLKPISQVLDILDSDIDILSEFFDQEIDLLALAEAANKFGQGHIEGIETFNQVREALKFLSVLQEFARDEHGDGAVNLGDVDLQNYDLRDITASTENAIVNGNNYTPNDSTDASAKTLLDYQVTQRGLSLPILENPNTIAKLFLGNQAVDLFKYDLPKLDLSTSISAKFPILGPILAKLEGGIQASADLGFGFDSQGLIDWQNSGQKNDLLNGFYIDDNREGSIDNPEAYITGYLKASAGADAYIASAFVGGGLEANLEVDLNDGGEFGDFLEDSDGKIRANEISSDPHCLLEAGGSLNANIFAEGKFLFWDKSKSWNKEIASFDLSCTDHRPSPILGNLLPGSILHLNVGDRADLRKEGNTKDISESIQLQRGESSSVIVQGFGHEETFEGVASITGAGGQGNDHLEAAQDATIHRVTFFGDAGDDLLRGGVNGDNLYGGFGQDQLYGHRGDDYIRGGDDDDLIKGGQGNDRIFGGNGNDVIEGDKDNDQLYGEAGNDLFKGEYDSDTIDGGDDIDTVSYEVNPLIKGGVSVNLQHGYAYKLKTPQRFSGEYQEDRLISIENAVGTSQADRLFGSNTANALHGGLGADTISGNGGDDTLDGGGGPDNLYGGEGDDTYQVYDASELIVEEQNQGIDTVRAQVSARYRQWQLELHLENLTLTQTDSSITSLTGYGNSEDNTLSWSNQTGNATFAPSLVFDGKTGNDLLKGNNGDDVLRGGIGDDTMIGGNGDDTYEVDSVRDEIQELDSQGVDAVGTYLDNYTLGANIENMTLNNSLYRGQAYNATGNALDNSIKGNNLNNRISAKAGHDQIQGFDGDDVLHGLEGDDSLDGGNGNDQLYGGAENDDLKGGTGNDVLHGGSDVDRMEGGAGNDTYYLDHADDLIIELANEGTDRVRTSLNNYQLGENLEGFDLLGDAVVGYGNSLNNYLRGHDRTDHAETLVGGAGDDHLTSYAGNDSLQGDTGNDLLNGGSGADTMTGGEGYDIYYVDDASDLVIESADAGFDRVRSSLNQYELQEHSERLELLDAAIVGYGNLQDNQLVANPNADSQLFGRAGKDSIFGQLGNDSLHGDQDDDYLKGNQGDDTVVGGDGNDALYGDSGRDLLIGAQIGMLNPNNHEIDVLTGGAEQDMFALGHASHASVFYTSGANNDYARITDFSEDIIQVKGNFEDYDLRIGAGGPVGANDTGIYFTKDGANDLIAVVENTTTLERSMFQELG